MYRENCASCGVGPFLKFCTLFGFTRIWPICKHGESRLRIHTIKYKLMVCPVFIISSALLSAIIYTGIKVNNTLRSKDIEEVMILIPNLFMYIGLEIALISMNCNVKTLLNAVQLAQDMAEDFRELKSIALLTVQEIISLRTETYILAMLLISNITGLFVIFFEVINMTNFHYLEKIGLLASFYFLNAFPFGLYHFHRVFYIMLKKYQFYLRQELSDIMDCSDFRNVKKRLTVIDNKLVKINIATSIASCNMLHSCGSRCFRLYNMYLNPGVLLSTVCIAFVVAFITVEDILIITGNNTGNVFNWKLVIANLALSGATVAVLFVSWLTTTWETMNYDMLSFLSKYPISKLDQDEADQIEAYMATLTKQKLIFNGSDVVMVNTLLYASLFGTIITYITTSMQIITYYK